jgi:hypothetical protein
MNTETPKLNPLDMEVEIENRAILAVAMECIANDELVAQFNRLTGCQLLKSAKRTPLEVAVDKACGYDGERDEDWQRWSQFVIDNIWLALPEEARHDFRVKALAEILEEGKQ